MNYNEKAGKVQFTDGTTRTFDYVDMRDNYAYCRKESGGERTNLYIPYHQIRQVVKLFNEKESGGWRNTTLQESADTENQSLAGIQK